MAIRDNSWLHQLLDETWDKYFIDVPQENDVRILFGRRTKNRLGSIKVDVNDPQTSIITINGLFKDERVPEFVVIATIVHELSHYAHGFNSPIEQKHRHPHAGGVMKQEFAERGLAQLYIDQRKWLKNNWRDFVGGTLVVTKSKTVTRQPAKIKIPRPFWFGN
ncbi:MAG: hypothetical protein ACHQUB_03045 [Candidatus Saccharimonadia bacterium]